MQRMPLAVVAVALLSGLAAPARAYERPAADIHIAYSALAEDSHGDTRTFPLGFVGGVSLNLGQIVAIPLEVAWHRRDISDLEITDATDSYLGFMGGLRFGRAAYGQVLAGGVKETIDFDTPSSSPLESDTKFAIQPGFGIDIQLSRAFALRIGGDFRYVFADPGLSQWRGHAGFAFGLGKR